EVQGAAAQIDLVAEKSVRQAAGVADAELIAILHRERVNVTANRRAKSADDKWTDRRAGGREAIGEDAAVRRVHELTRLAVTERHDCETDSDVGLERLRAAERHEPYDAGDRRDVQLQVLPDFRTVRVDDIAIDARYRVAVVAQAGADRDVRPELDD